MKITFYNSGYFLREAKNIFNSNLLSNILSFVCTVLIFFILAMVISGWWISRHVVVAIQNEAEINVYFKENLGQAGTLRLIEDIQGINGVKEARLVDAAEAHGRMVEILADEARVLELFDGNPFSPFIEIKINLEKIYPVLEQLTALAEVEHVRDNRAILERIASLARILRFLGYLVISAAAISTLILISHLIRLGIYNNKDQADTLRLLGAPESFIALPFLLEGLLLTLAGALLAAILSSYTLSYVYALVAAPLPFIPLPPAEMLVPGLIILVASLGILLGIVGSLFGLASARQN